MRQGPLALGLILKMVAPDQELQRVMKPLAAAATALPPAALRADPAVAVTIARYLPQLLQVSPCFGQCNSQIVKCFGRNLE